MIWSCVKAIAFDKQIRSEINTFVEFCRIETKKILFYIHVPWDRAVFFRLFDGFNILVNIFI